MIVIDGLDFKKDELAESRLSGSPYTEAGVSTPLGKYIVVFWELTIELRATKKIIDEILSNLFNLKLRVLLDR